MKKSNISKVESSKAGLAIVFIIKPGLIPSEKRTTISLSFDSLKRESVAATKNEIGRVKNRISGSTKRYNLAMSNRESCITAVYVASLIENITEAIANRGINIDIKSVDKLLSIYF